MGATFDRFLAVQRRFVQFRLRTVLAVMTLACVASAAYGWHWRHSRRLDVMVEHFNNSLDKHRFDEAEIIALEAMRRYPQEPVAAVMVDKARILTGNGGGAEWCECHVRPGNFELSDADRWRSLSHLRKSRCEEGTP